MKYRYVPQWRFKFENKHAQFKSTLEKNCVKRDKYNNLEYLIFDNELPKPSKLSILYEILGILGFLSLGMIYFFHKEALLFFVAPLFILNGLILLIQKNKFQG